MAEGLSKISQRGGSGVKIYDILRNKEFVAGAHAKDVLEDTSTHKVLTVTIDAGAQIPPCTMGSHTLFFVVEGEGTIRVGSDTRDIAPGQIVSIEPGIERNIKAETKMVVLAIQIHG
ncbi:MAG: cupin domain-containing protein [Firmicutes bacterium]|nr:cupin domain-containing protein [Bacillota bacterium]